MRIRWLGAVALCMSVAACGGNETKEVDCGSAIEYQNRVEGRRVVAPEGLDSLNELAEMVHVAPTRIKKERWVENAKKAHFEKYKERIGR